MKKLAIPLVLILGGLAALLALGVIEGGIPEIQARELANGGYRDQVVKVHGILQAIDSGERPLRFIIADKDQPTALVPVYADKTRPDTFQVTYDVSVEGRWDEERGAFVARQIFTKCPSKYEAEAKQGIGNPKEYEKRTGKKLPAEQTQ